MAKAPCGCPIFDTDMPRANRHYVPNCVWHITHRCHDRDFLLRYSQDRSSWVSWLAEARRRYGLAVLDYCVTHNHIHVLVFDDGPRETIPQCMKLVAGTVAQRYNERRGRKGAFWEDRYHATAIQTGNHLLNCIAYIDLNMVRAGMVSHPSQWLHGGYRELQMLNAEMHLDTVRLMQLCGCTTVESFRKRHQKIIESALDTDRGLKRDERWSESIAVGDEPFLEGFKASLGCRGRKRAIQSVPHDDEDESGLVLREPVQSYEGNNEGAFWGIARYLSGQNSYPWE
ncbi:MAG: transposase [Chitinivibrionales bacterium]|nr:transposase [Chitinivibrionales bacterium]